MSEWNNTVEYLKGKVKGFDVKTKDGVWHQELIGKLMFFAPFMLMWSALYPIAWKPEGASKRARVLQHEGIHLMDAQTFYGLLPAWPVLKYINILLFSLCYAAPQIFGFLALLAFTGNLWWLLALVYFLPLPSPGRMIAEMRAYRRSREQGRKIESMIQSFVTKKYYFMWPFKKHVAKMLTKDSPYKEEMDKLIVF